MNIDNLTIGDARAVASMFPKTAPAPCCERDCGVRIVILQRGWVVIGHVYESEREVRVEKAAVVRRWGTTKGLGELAANGPFDKTTLDDCGDVRAHPLAVVAQIDCVREKWYERI